MLFGILLVFFIIVCIFLCLIILIQSDKGGGISGAIGGLSGASNFLGTQDTANILTKGTAVLGTAFLVLCIVMTFLASNGTNAAMSKSEMQKRAEKAQTENPTPMGEPGMEMKKDDGTEVLPGLSGDEEASQESAQQKGAEESAEKVEPEQKPAESVEVPAE
ncbi:MAG: preprotein translocase subunit SecG [Chitinispirillaceae bacterium]